MAQSARLKSLGGVVRAGESYQGKQGPDYVPGVSAETVGSQALWLGSVTLPPRGGRTKAHLHENHESAFCLISGEDVVAEGEKVVTRWTKRGTHQGEIEEFGEPTGKQVEIKGVTIHRIEGGKIAEEWERYDNLGVMQQLGAISEVGQAGS